MKCTVKANELQSAIKAMLAIHSFGEGGDRQVCDLTVAEAGLYCRSAKLGAFLIRRLDCQVLRMGTCGVDAKEIDALKLAGDVTLDVQEDKLIVTGKRVKYTVPLDATAVQELNQQHEQLPRPKAQARIPALMLKGGTQYTTFKSDTVKSDFDVQVTVRDSFFEYAGIDHVAIACYRKKDEIVQAKQQVAFILGASLLHKVVGEIADDFVMLAVSEDGALVRIFSPDGAFDLHHPIIDKDYIDLATETATVYNQESICTATLRHGQLKSAVDALNVVGKKMVNGTVQIDVVQTAEGSSCKATIDAANAKAEYNLEPSTQIGSGCIRIRAQYLADFVKVAPKTELEMTAWQEHLRICADAVEYLILQDS